MNLDNIDLAAAYRDAESNAKARQEKQSAFSMEDIRNDALELMDKLETDELIISGVVSAFKSAAPEKYKNIDHSRVRSAVLAGGIFELIDTSKGKGFARKSRKYPVPLEHLPKDVQDRVKDDAENLIKKVADKVREEKAKEDKKAGKTV